MARHKAPAKTKRLVWRISDHAPLGEWVDPNLPPPPRPEEHTDDPHDTPGGWRRSTYDLLNGVDIDDNPNTVPDDLFDELFGPSKTDNAKTPRK
ncbi:hypothetical protein [Piscinibacter sp. HJYY11]|uniref:hypothetical protein n=1 Tax=Piscinibacter sp. HJYY11 TaxID=2801333 RepID=UPI00191F30B7|nr:hypothetical protein [Piscinibacter sp. HJYY11]MBL0730400.1 hypothetical protein [Piscinibacter sp. HJYY11]